MLPVATRLARHTQPASDLSPNGMAGCIVWTGATTKQGYGAINIGGRPDAVHRVAWRLAGGDIPDGMELDHLCRRRGCVNPDHLEPVTGAENTRRGAKAKVTLTQAREIRALRMAGWRRRDIAAAYGISRSIVYDIARGHTWAEAA